MTIYYNAGQNNLVVYIWLHVYGDYYSSNQWLCNSV